MKNWYSICALTDGAEISIYDEIGAYGVSAKAFLADLGILEFLLWLPPVMQEVSELLNE